MCITFILFRGRVASQVLYKKKRFGNYKNTV